MRKAVQSLVLLVLIPFLCFAQGGTEAAQPGISVRNSDISRTLAELNTLYQYLKVNALYELDSDMLEDNLTRALVSSIDDPFAEYVTSDHSAELDEMLSGTYVGIGVYITKYDPLFIDWDDETTYMVQITSPFPGGPAERAGLRARDLISSINGELVYQLTAEECSQRLRGEEGVPITLTVHRGDSIFELDVTPELVTTPSVVSAMIDGTDYGYMMIPEFSESTYTLVSSALRDLSAKGMQALIIDLRNNSGGTVDTACLVANFFLDEGDTIISIEYNEGSWRNNTRILASVQTRKYHIPVVVLVNGGTASASEILSAALQDNDSALIIGQQTFGKGVMQDVIPWNDGFIRYTSSHYLTPDGDNIHEVGISPDIIVEEPQLDDAQLEEYYRFVSEKSQLVQDWADAHPEYSSGNIEAFAAQYGDEVSFDPLYLKILVRNAYINGMDWEDRPVVDRTYDLYLTRAIDYLDSL